MILSKNSDIILKYKELLKKNTTKDLIVTDDLSVIKLALTYPIDIEAFIYCKDLSYHEDTKLLIEELKKRFETYEISKSVYESLRQKENSAGLLAIIKLKTYTFNDLKNKDFIVVTDSLEIPGNLGTIYRTMDSAKADALILVDPITKLTNNKLTSSARGCNLLIPSVCTSYNEAQNWLLENGYKIYLGEPNLGKCYKDYDYQGKIAIVVGNERFGIHNEWYSHAHEKVFIPMYGSNNSLNVSVAASILIYEATMKRQK